MSHYIISEAGIYRATLEQMLYGAPSTSASEKKVGFKDQNLDKKKRPVSKLVEKFEKGIDLDETIASFMDDMHIEEQVPEDLTIKEEEVVPVPKPRTKFSKNLELERFYNGIRATSSPIPSKEVTPETTTEAHMDIVETPILPYCGPVDGARGVDFEKLGTVVTKPGAMYDESTKLKKVEKLPKSSSKPNVGEHVPKGTIHKAKTASMAHIKPPTPPATTSTKPTPRSTCSSTSSPGSYVSSGSSSSPGSLGCLGSSSTSTSSDIPQDMDFHLKLARAKIHEQFQYYYNWSSQTLRMISSEAATLRFTVLSRIPRHLQDNNTRTMMEIYERCKAGNVSKEMDVLCCSIFHLLEDHVHEETVSIFEEYVVEKYSRKLMIR